MKPPTRAPFFACLYHGLCDVARKHGYALTIHGTVTTDLDLVAIPWVDDAVSPEELRAALMSHLGACGYADLLRKSGHSEEFVAQIIARGEAGTMDAGTPKPHGRIAWNLYLEHGAKVDLSVMPRSQPKDSHSDDLAKALADCISTFRTDDKTTMVTAERQEAWRAALLRYNPDHVFP